jgi:hypothetical protein
MSSFPLARLNKGALEFLQFFSLHRRSVFRREVEKMMCTQGMQRLKHAAVLP